MNTDSRKNAKLSTAAHQQLVTLSDATNTPITKILDEFTGALRTNKSTIELMIARSGKFNLNEALTVGIEELARQADRAYYRRRQEAEQLKQVKSEVKPVVNSIIKDNVASCKHWDELQEIINNVYPDYSFTAPANCLEFFNKPYHYQSQLVEQSTRGEFKLNGSLGTIEKAY